MKIVLRRKLYNNSFRLSRNLISVQIQNLKKTKQNDFSYKVFNSKVYNYSNHISQAKKIILS